MSNDEIIRREKDDDSPLSAARHYDLLVVNHTSKLDEAVSVIVDHLAD